MWLVSVVLRRYIDILIIIINFPYSTCIRSFFGNSILTSLFILKMFFRSYTMERRCGQYSVTILCRCDVYAFNLRRSMYRPLMIDVSTFEDRCVDFRRSMCRLSKIDDRCVDLRRSTIDVSTFEDRCVDLRRSMCRPSKIDD